MKTGQKEDIKKTLSVIKEGGVAVLPTETVYGLGADAANKAALAKIYGIKGRDWRKQLALAVRDVSWLSRWGLVLSTEQKNVLSAFWPGPLTLVVRAASEELTKLEAVFEETVALRCPDHPLLQRLLRGLDRPIALTSANRSGEDAPVDLKEVDEDILAQADCVLDGGYCLVAEPSSIVSMVDGIEVLREGPVSEEDVARAASGKIR